MLMLVVSELGEAMEAHRKGLMTTNEDWLKYGETGDFKSTIKDKFEDEIADSIDDGYIVNMFIKDVEDKDEVLSTTLGDLLKDKFMLNMKTERECKNNTLRYMVVNTDS